MGGPRSFPSMASLKTHDEIRLESYFWKLNFIKSSFLARQFYIKI